MRKRNWKRDTNKREYALRRVQLLNLGNLEKARIEALHHSRVTSKSTIIL
jgi:hypothetical protein